MYVGKLFDGSIPYERMDRRVFRMLWEHKKVMLERLTAAEHALGLRPAVSTKYSEIVREANAMRMLYASHHMRRRDCVLPGLQKKLLRDARGRGNLAARIYGSNERGDEK